MSEQDYVLGTHNAEIERLGLQHRVWRPMVLDVWQRAGIMAGKTVLDLGAGPGYASIDLAEIVGPTGKVIAVERSQRFLNTLAERANQRELKNIQTLEADVTEPDLGKHLGAGVADFSWIRWLLCFVNKPEQVIQHLRHTLKPGGTAIFHEYIDYKSWKMFPAVPEQEAFVDAVIASWRAGGGEPDIARNLPTMLQANGFDMVEMRPLVFILTPQDPMWQWPMSFIHVNFDRLIELGYMNQSQAQQNQAAILKAAEDGQHCFVTPMVLEVVARRKV